MLEVNKMEVCGTVSSLCGRWLHLPDTLSPALFHFQAHSWPSGQRSSHVWWIINHILLATVTAPSIGLGPGGQPKPFPARLYIEEERENHLSFCITKLKWRTSGTAWRHVPRPMENSSLQWSRTRPCTARSEAESADRNNWVPPLSYPWG